MPPLFCFRGKLQNERAFQVMDNTVPNSGVGFFGFLGAEFCPFCPLKQMGMNGIYIAAATRQLRPYNPDWFDAHVHTSFNVSSGGLPSQPAKGPGFRVASLGLANCCRYRVM